MGTLERAAISKILALTASGNLNRASLSQDKYVDIVVNGNEGQWLSIYGGGEGIATVDFAYTDSAEPTAARSTTLATPSRAITFSYDGMAS